MQTASPQEQHSKQGAGGLLQHVHKADSSPHAGQRTAPHASHDSRASSCKLFPAGLPLQMTQQALCNPSSTRVKFQTLNPISKCWLMSSAGRALCVGLGADEQQLAVREVQQRGVRRRNPRVPACTSRAW